MSQIPPKYSSTFFFFFFYFFPLFVLTGFEILVKPLI